MTRPRLRRRDWLLADAHVFIGLTCIRLGLWQLDRRSQRRARDARIASRPDQPAILLRSQAFDPQDVACRPVQTVLVNRSRDGVPGVRLPGLVRIEDSTASVRVDRGWIRVGLSSHQAWAVYDVDGPIDIAVIIRVAKDPHIRSLLRDAVPAPGEPALETWRLRHVQGIQSQIPYPTQPIFREQTEALPGRPPSFLDPDLSLTQGPHRPCDIRWFAFGTIAGGGSPARIGHRAGGGVA
jgi:surfeit locus 1 family protein